MGVNSLLLHSRARQDVWGPSSPCICPGSQPPPPSACGAQLDPQCPWYGQHQGSWRQVCGTNACEGIGGQYGHGRTIDTGKPYRISHSQIMNGELMSTSSHHFSQEGRTASFNACNQDSMGYIGYDLHDIVAVFSLWHMGCDEQWLDGCTGCNNCCDLASASVTFSNFELTHARDSNIPEVREAWMKMHPEEN